MRSKKPDDAGAPKEDPDRAAILARRARLIASALAGLAVSNMACADTVVDRRGSSEAVGASGAVTGSGGAPQPCLDAPIGGAGGEQPCLGTDVGGAGGRSGSGGNGGAGGDGGGGGVGGLPCLAPRR